MAESPYEQTTQVWGQSGLTPILDQWVAKHGPLQGKGYAIDPIIDNPGILGGKQENPMPTYRYVFADGSTLEGKWDGSIKDQNEVDPAKALAAVKTAQDPYGGTWERDANGAWKPAIHGDPSLQAGSQLDVAKKMRLEAEINNNAAAGRGNLTDDQWNQLQVQLRGKQLDENTLRQRISEFEQKNANDIRQLNIAQQAETRLGGSAAAQNALIAAQTTGTGVETRMNEERLRQLILAGPKAQQAAVLANQVTQAQLDEYKRKAGQPTVLGAQEGAYMTTMSPTGQIEQRMSLGYQPKTKAEVAGRIGQIQSAANAKKAEVMQKYANDPERALQEFNAWYDANVQSQMAGLQAAQEEAEFGRAKDTAEMRRQAYQQAAAAGSTVLSAYNAAAPRRVGEGAAAFMKQATEQGNLKGLDWSNAAFTPSADLSEMYRKETQEALKYIDPTSAQATGQPMPNYAQLNPAEVLNRSQWFPGGQAAPAPTPGGPPAPAAGPTPEQLANRQRASQQTAAATAAFGGGFGAINPQGMAAVMPAEQPALTPEETGFGGPIAANPMATAMAAAKAAPAVRRAPVAAAAPAPAPYVPSVNESLARLGTGFTPQPPGFGYDPTQLNYYEPGPYVPPPAPTPTPGSGLNPGAVPGYGGPVGVPVPPGFGYDPSHMYQAGPYSFMVP